VAASAIAAGDVLLSLEHVSLSFGGSSAARRLLLASVQGRDPRHHGPNGAGKTSMLNVINGFYHPSKA
jgi:branched-chain amino acid transport system ATP-binding protein